MYDLYYGINIIEQSLYSMYHGYNVWFQIKIKTDDDAYFKKSKQ